MPTDYYGGLQGAGPPNIMLPLVIGGLGYLLLWAFLVWANNRLGIKKARLDAQAHERRRAKIEAEETVLSLVDQHSRGMCKTHPTINGRMPRFVPEAGKDCVWWISDD